MILIKKKEKENIITRVKINRVDVKRSCKRSNHHEGTIYSDSCPLSVYMGTAKR